MDQIKEKLLCPLTRRELLGQVASLCDPIGLVTPLKQKGAILVRKAFQQAAGGRHAREMWDTLLLASLRQEATGLIEELVQLSQVTFKRSLTPAGWIRRLCGITLSDESDNSFGAVVYFRWETKEGI